MGKWPVDYARTHKTYQVLHLTTEKQKAEKELHDIQDTGQKIATGVIDIDDLDNNNIVEKKVTQIGTKLVADKVDIPTFKELQRKDLWNKRPNRSKVMTLQQQLAAVEAAVS